MAGVIALYGSGEFTPAVKEIDTFVLDNTPAPNVLILPIAAGQEDDHHKWIDDGIAHFQSLGLEAGGLDIMSRQEADSVKTRHVLEKYSCFFFSGGDPGFLLDTIKETLLWQTILSLHQEGATIAGSSAGAMVLGSSVWARVYDYDKKGIMRPWEPGLGLLDFGILPHYNFMQSQFSLETRSEMLGNIPANIRVIGIDEDTAYIKVGNTWVKKGKGKVHDPVKVL